MPEPSFSSLHCSTPFELPITSPLPTPPSSKTVIPTQCFPSPTSVADLANSRPAPSTRPFPPQPRPHQQKQHYLHNLAPTSHVTSQPPQSSTSASTTTPTTTTTTATSSSSPLSSSSSSSLSPSPSCDTQSSLSANDTPEQRNHSQFSMFPHSSSSSSSTASNSSSSNATPTIITTSNSASTTISHSTSMSTPPPSEHDAASSSDSSNHSDYPSSAYVSPPRSADQIPFYFPHLANSNPSAPLAPVTKAQFIDTLASFKKDYPPEQPVTDPAAFVDSLRRLLDHLDTLCEQLPLKHSTALFSALSTSPALDYLLFLLSDVSATSEQAEKDVRKAYRYPHLISAILANGSMVIRDAFIANEHLVHHLLSFLDGHVPLHPSAMDLSTSNPPNFAKDNKIIIVNVIQILVSYLETNPDALLSNIEHRSSFVPALVSMIDVGAVPKLIVSLIPDVAVHELTTIDHANVTFDSSLTWGLNLLANADIYRLLADAFIQSAQKIYSLSGSMQPDTREEERANQIAHNVTDVYEGLVAKTIRAIRVNPNMAACQHLNVFSNPRIAETLAQILQVATHLFRETRLQHSAVLCDALSLTLRMLRVLQYDLDIRVASVIGPPPALSTDALQMCLRPVLRDLLDSLVDVAKCRDERHSTVILHIMDVFVEVCRIASTETLATIHSMRFGELMLKMVMLFPQNSLLHHVACRAVEDALVSRTATTEAAYHWLVQCNLPKRVIMSWYHVEGSERWKSPKEAQAVPVLSALVHMACCIHHWMAMEVKHHGRGSEMNLMSEELVEEFRLFWDHHMVGIMASESPLGGSKPRRKGGLGGGSRGGSGGGSMGMSFGLGGSNIRMSRWSGPVRNFGPVGGGSGNFGIGSGFGIGFSDDSGADVGNSHLVRSDSAHRFGFVEPSSVSRSRFDDVFVEGEEDFGECGSVASFFDSDDGVG